MAFFDRFKTYTDNVSSPANRSTPIVPSNTEELPYLPKAVYVGGGGAIVGRLKDDAADRTWTVQAGAILPGRFKLIKETGTTATGLLALD